MISPPARVASGSPRGGRYGHVLLSTWVADHERTVLVPADVATMLGDDGAGATGGPATANTFNQVTSWQARAPRGEARGAPAGQTARVPAAGAGPGTEGTVRNRRGAELTCMTGVAGPPCARPGA
jgi:hypothetical protein